MAYTVDEITRLIQGEVIGDGTAASSGEGGPASSFAVNHPDDLAIDEWDNLYVTSLTALRAVVPGPMGGDWAATPFGREPRNEFPATLLRCVSAVAVAADDTIWIGDRCQRLMIKLTRD